MFFPEEKPQKQHMKFPDCITLHHTYRPCRAAGMTGGQKIQKKPKSRKTGYGFLLLFFLDLFYY